MQKKIAKTSNIKFKNICNIKMSHLEAANKANKYIAVRLENANTKRQLNE